MSHFPKTLKSEKRSKKVEELMGSFLLGTQEMREMKAKKKVSPSDFILSVLSPEERLEITLRIAKEAFKESDLSLTEIEEAVQRIRRKIYEGRERKSTSKGRS